MRNLVLGIDLGNGYVKAVAGLKNIIMLPSVIAPARDLGYAAEQLSDGDQCIISYAGRDWFVGQFALDYAAGSTFEVFGRQRDTEAVRILMYAALSELLEHGVTDVALWGGVPTDWYTYEKEGALDVLRNDGSHSFRRNGELYTLVVKHAGIFPQPMGAFVATAYDPVTGDPGMLAEGNALVLDIGQHTTDKALIRGGRYIPIDDATDPHGMRDVSARLAALVEEEHGRTIRNGEVRSVLETGRLKLMGREGNVSDLVHRAIEPLALRVLQFARVTVGDGGDLDAVIVTGGGAHALRDWITREYPELALFTARPQTANALGMWMYARSKWVA